MRESLLLKKSAALLATVILGWVAFAPSASAADLFPPGSTGYDISFPQCNAPLPKPPYAFAILGATGGKPFTDNPCLPQQFAWAAATGSQPSVYFNLKAPIGSNAEEGTTGPSGTCTPTDERCRSYNFGYKSAQHAVAYVKSKALTPASWWLDVETMNSWSTNTSDNARVIEGAIDCLKGQGFAIGIYSNPTQWKIIAGTYMPGLPVWTTTAPGAVEAPSFCSRPFGGGQVTLVQYLSGGFDVNYVCRPEDRIVSAPISSTPLGPVGSLATIFAEGDCLNVRGQPSTDGPRTACLPTGTVVTLMDGAVVADGYRWQRISAGSVSGWVASAYLRLGASAVTQPPPIATPTPTPMPTPPPGTFATPPVFGPGGQSLVVFNGGTIDQLEASAIAGGATGVWAQTTGGAYQLLVMRGPTFLNAPFRAAFPTGLKASTALTLTK